MSRHEKDASHHHEKKTGFGAWVRNRLITGIVVAAPITLTVWLVFSFVNFVDQRVKPLIPKPYNPETYLPFAIPGLGVVVVLLVLTILGTLTANILGRTLLKFGEGLVDRVPFIRAVYSTIKQIIDMIASQKERSFREVCLIEYPKPGVYALGFISGDAKGELKESLGEDYVGVFVPTAPNPTSGFLLYEKRDNLKLLDIKPETGARLILSLGLVSPEEARKMTKQETL